MTRTVQDLNTEYGNLYDYNALEDDPALRWFLPDPLKAHILHMVYTAHRRGNWFTVYTLGWVNLATGQMDEAQDTVFIVPGTTFLTR